jgi:hypothetical protein
MAMNYEKPSHSSINFPMECRSRLLTPSLRFVGPWTEMRRHDTYCGNFSSTPATLAVVCVLERGVRWVCRAIVQDRRQTLLCQAVAHFLQLAGAPQSLDLESWIAIQQTAGCDQAQRERD